MATLQRHRRAARSVAAGPASDGAATVTVPATPVPPPAVPEAPLSLAPPAVADAVAAGAEMEVPFVEEALDKHQAVAASAEPPVVAVQPQTVDAEAVPESVAPEHAAAERPETSKARLSEGVAPTALQLGSQACSSTAALDCPAPAMTALLEIPGDFTCPITQELMVDPVVCADGNSYERTALELWLSRGNRTSPLTNEPLAFTTLIPNNNLRKAAAELREHMPRIQQMQLDERARRRDLEAIVEALQERQVSSKDKHVTLAPAKVQEAEVNLLPNAPPLQMAGASSSTTALSGAISTDVRDSLSPSATQYATASARSGQAVAWATASPVAAQQPPPAPNHDWAVFHPEAGRRIRRGETVPGFPAPRNHVEVGFFIFMQHNKRFGKMRIKRERRWKSNDSNAPTAIPPLDSRGQWVVPERMWMTNFLLSGGSLDFRRARFVFPETTIYANQMLFSGTRIIVPPGVHVEVNGVGFFGLFRGSGQTWPTTTGPVLRLVGSSIMFADTNVVVDDTVPPITILSQ